MTKAQADRLDANVRQDGVLTSTPLTYRFGDMAEEIISGHHRVDAAISADLPKVAVIRITSFLSEERKVALQISHNAITGQDEPGLLAQMFQGLDMGAKLYSGLDDSILKGAELGPLPGVSVGLPYREITLLFLPDDEAVVTTALKGFGPKATIHAAAYADFAAFFDLVVKAKTKAQIMNSAMAIRYVVDLAAERLAQLEGDDGEPS